MGIYDRDYYRREGSSFLGSFTERGTVCKWLIAANVACFIIQLLTRKTGQAGMESVSGAFTNWLLLDVDRVLHGEIWRLVTCAFLHSESSVFHIIINMLFLWWFGSDVEDLYGPREFLTFYLTAAAAGSVAFVLGSLAGVPGDKALGASGAVTAVMVLCALHYPTRVIYVFFFLPLPIWIFVLFLVALDVFGILGAGGPGQNVAFSGHLGGAAFAFAYYKFHWRLTSMLPDLRAWFRQRSRPRLKVYREDADPRAKVTVTAPRTGREVDEHLEAKVDAVLEKVARLGKDSLTESEKELLLRASEIYKKKRS